MLRPADDSDKSASDFIEHARSGIYLHTDPYVYFRASILFFRYHAHDLDVIAEEEYIEARDDVLKELVGKPPSSGMPVMIGTVAVLWGIFYFTGMTDDSIGHVASIASLTGVGILVGLIWRSSMKYRNWVASLPASEKLKILDDLQSEAIIDQKCHDTFAKHLQADSE